MDLIARRYPNRRPSDYLGIEDEFTAYQIDSVLALKYEREDREFTIKIVEAIRSDLENVMRALGAKVKKKQTPSKQLPKPSGELPRLKDVIAALGGRGVVLQYNKKKE